MQHYRRQDCIGSAIRKKMSQGVRGPFAPLRPQPFRSAFLVITLTVLLLSCWAERVGKARLDEVR